MSELMNYALTHKNVLTGVVVGFGIGHIDDIVSFLFTSAMKIGFIRSWVTTNPDKAKAAVDAIAKELDRDIDQEVKEQVKEIESTISESAGKKPDDKPAA